MVRSRSYIATPPGATIKEQLNDRGMSQKEFAARMDMSEKHISKLINGDVQLTPETAVRLEMVLGVPARFWNNLEAIYREKIIKAEAENAMDADAEMAKQFPYCEMAKFGWFIIPVFPMDVFVGITAFCVVAWLFCCVPSLFVFVNMRQISKEKAEAEEYLKYCN